MGKQGKLENTRCHDIVDSLRHDTTKYNTIHTFHHERAYIDVASTPPRAKARFGRAIFGVFQTPRPSLERMSPQTKHIEHQEMFEQTTIDEGHCHEVNLPETTIPGLCTIRHYQGVRVSQPHHNTNTSPSLFETMKEIEYPGCVVAESREDTNGI
jgi:hypothetical protein